MSWLRDLQALRERREPAVLVTVTAVRGHAPRDAGAKMVVSAARGWGSVGGGNLEATVLGRARAMLAAHAHAPETLILDLSEKAPVTYGKQCCGGEVTVLLEPVPVVGAVAIFGMGHVGQELARLLSRHDLELHLVDSREEYATPGALPALADAEASIHWHHAPWPDPVLAELPRGTHVLVMTHDHAEDAALCDAALRCRRLGSVGLIGSSVKWRRIERRLREEGHSDTETARIITPIGDRRIAGKEPATIALSIAVDVLDRIATRRSAAVEGVP